MISHGVLAPRVAMAAFAAVLAVFFGYGCLVSWSVLALGYWGLLAVFVYTQVKSWHEDQSVAAFLSLEQKQHEKKLKNIKKQKIVTKKSRSKKAAESVTAEVSKPEPVVAEVGEIEEIEEIVEEMPAQPVEAEKAKKKAKKPKLQNKKVDAKVDVEALLINSSTFEVGEFQAVPSVEQKKQKAAHKRTEKLRQEAEQHKKDAEAKKQYGQLKKASAEKAAIRTDEAFQELKNSTPKQNQLPTERQKHAASSPSVTLPTVVAPKAKVVQSAVQQKSVTKEMKAEKKPVPPPGVSVWEIRAQERADANVEEALVQNPTAFEEITQQSMPSQVCPDYATFGICPRGDTCAWTHENPNGAVEPCNEGGQEKILYLRGMLVEENEHVIWSRDNMCKIELCPDDFEEGWVKTDPADLDTQKTPLAPGALPFLPWAVREEFSTQYTTLNLGF